MNAEENAEDEAQEEPMSAEVIPGADFRVDAQTVSAEHVEIHQGAAQTVQGKHVEIHQGGAQFVEAESVVIEQGGALSIQTNQASLRQSGAGILSSETAVLEQDSTVGILVARRVDSPSIQTNLILAGEVYGDVKTTVSTHGALLAGIGVGIGLGLVLSFKSLMSGKLNR